MDEGIQRLAREASTRRGDVAAARRLELALARGGRRAELQQLYHAKFLCPFRFEELTPSEDPLRRSCGGCGRRVRFAPTWVELGRRAVEGLCVAFERRLLRDALELLIEHPDLHTAFEPRRPCLVPTDLRFVLLDGFEPDPAVWRVLDPDVARHYFVFPLLVTDDEVVVAIGDPSAEAILRDLSLHTGRTVRPVLAPRDAIERAVRRAPASPHRGFSCGFFHCLRTEGSRYEGPRHRSPRRRSRPFRRPDEVAD